MISVFMLLSFVTVQVSALGLIEQPPMQCSQEELSCSFHINRTRCSTEGRVKPRYNTPGLPEVRAEVLSRADDSGEIVPVLSLTLTEPSDASIYSLEGTEVHVLEVATNSSVCGLYTFPSKPSFVVKKDEKPWSFTLDRIVVDPGLKYQVSVSNLPKPDMGIRAVVQNITVPGCANDKIRKLKACLENGSLWEPDLTWSVNDSESGGRVITMTFNTGQFSELYRVDIRHPDFHTSLSLTVSKDNRTSVSVQFSLDAWQLKRCEFVFAIKPFFVRCMNSCLEHQQKVQLWECKYFYTVLDSFLYFMKKQNGLLDRDYASNKRPKPRQHMVWTVFGLSALILCAFMAVWLHSKSNEDSYSSDDTTDDGGVKYITEEKPSKVLILYSLDHPLYKEIILKLCAFLMTKCGTEVTLDLLDFTSLSTVGRIQWLDMQRESLSRSSDKVLILCSPGVYAKWKGLCGGNRVMTREDVRSCMGDMLTPALNLIVLDFVHASSFQKYIVAYFDDVCSEKDVPGPFNVGVKYRLMKHFEELFFRLVDKEKHEPGRIKQVEGIGEEDYFNSSPGRALRDAINAFQAYQLENPNWFEMELVDADEEVEESGHELDGGAEINCDCILQNQLWVRDIAGPISINNVEGQLHELEPPNSEDIASNFSSNEIYSTMPLHSY